MAKIPRGDAGQDEEEPEVSAEDEEELEGALAQHGLPQVQGSVHQHCAEVDKHHHQEGPGSLDQEDPLEKEMATHSSILAWETPWTEEPGGLQPMELQRVRHD